MPPFCPGLLIKKGAGAHLEIKLLDVDPYGEAWPTIKAFFASPRPFAGRMMVVANDGLRQLVRSGSAWRSKTLSDVVEMYGNHRIWEIYLDVCYELLHEAVQPAGYSIRFFDGYHTGRYKKMTHFLALLRQ